MTAALRRRLDCSAIDDLGRFSNRLSLLHPVSYSTDIDRTIVDYGMALACDGIGIDC